MQNPTELTALRDFSEWKEKCDVKGQPFCSLPNACPLTTREIIPVVYACQCLLDQLQRA